MKTESRNHFYWTLTGCYNHWVIIEGNAKKVITREAGWMELKDNSES